MPHYVDEAVGQKLIELRILRGLSQAALAEDLGISFQQVQKYEKGSNRISASKLFEISEVLNVPIETLFESVSTDPKPLTDAERRNLKIAAKISRIPNQAVQEILEALITVAADLLPDRRTK